MRRARIKYEGSYHHVMNRGINGENVFPNIKSKQHFIELLKELSKRFGIEIFAYCIMDNHFHIVLRNNLNRLSAFMKELDGAYGMYYRLVFGGKGYVFMSRFKSTLIENDEYLRMSIIYTLLNPEKAEIVLKAEDYRWSSISEYFNENGKGFIERNKVEEIFHTKELMIEALREWGKRNLPVWNSRVGEYLGSEEFFRSAMEIFDRRKEKGVESNMRMHQKKEVPIEESIATFEKERGIGLKELQTNKKMWKKIRAELLCYLHGIMCFTYVEISKHEYFRDIQLSSLGKIYSRHKT